MASRDLTTLQNVKTYLGISAGDSDALLSRLITAMSDAFVREVGQEVLRRPYSEVIDSTNERIRYSQWGIAINLNGPVIGDPVVTIDGTLIPKRPDLDSYGWVLIDNYRLELAYSWMGLVGWGWTGWIGNVSLVYEGGEYVDGEPATVPGTTPYTVQAQQALGTFVSDIGVTYANGTALAKVTGNPAMGQYNVNSTGLYTFAVGDANAAVALSYAYLPSVVEDCVIEMVAFKFRKRERLDQVSANMGGQSVFFSRDAWPVTVQQVLDSWGPPNV